jgi:outer membrane biosynthesis protein TonB
MLPVVNRNCCNLGIECHVIGDLGGISLMRYPSRFGVVICLIGSTFASVQSGAASTARNQEAPVSDSTSQEPKKPAGLGGIDILSDTMGVDFGPYLQRVLKTVKENWYHLAPASAKGPKMMQGVVLIEFAILKKGKVAGMKLAGRTEDTPMNAAAWHAIADSRFPLSAEFPGQYLALRFHFVYNPPKPTDAILQYREGDRL